MSDAKIVILSLGYFIVLSFLLPLAGVGSSTIFIPNAAPEEQGSNMTVTQNFGTAVGECVVTGILTVVTFGGIQADCSRRTVSETFTNILNVFSFAKAAFLYLFQLLTFQVPEIPAWLHAMLVLPPGAGLGFVALKLIRGTGS